MNLFKRLAVHVRIGTVRRHMFSTVVYLKTSCINITEINGLFSSKRDSTYVITTQMPNWSDKTPVRIKQPTKTTYIILSHFSFSN